MNFLKTLKQSEVANEKDSGKKMFQKCREILKDYKYEHNPFKDVFKAHFLITLQALSL